MKVLFLALTKGGERVRRTGEGEQANRQERKKEGGRETGENHYFLCVTAVGASKLKQGEGSNRKEETRREEWRKKRSTATPGTRRNPSQVGRHTHTAGLNTNQLNPIIPISF